MADVTLAASAGTVDDDFARDWVRRYTDAWRSRDPERFAALLAADVRLEDPFAHPDGVLRGRDALRAWLTAVWRAMPDLDFEVVGEPMVSLDRTRIAAMWRGRGTMTGRLDPPGFAPTGSVIEMTGCDVHRFRAGACVEVVTYTDGAAVARQLGAAPAPGSRAERLGVVVQRAVALRRRPRGRRSVRVGAG